MLIYFRKHKHQFNSNHHYRNNQKNQNNLMYEKIIYQTRTKIYL
jgi:hypothetical protein